MKRPVAVLRQMLLALLGVMLPTQLRAQLTPNDQSARMMRLERFVMPEFPPFLRQAGVLHGTVVVAIGHDERGKASDLLVLESTDPRFTDAALDAIREWRFLAPATSATTGEATIPVVRFLFTTGAISIVPLTTSSGVRSRTAVRAETPIELPNFSHLDHPPKALHAPQPQFPATLREPGANGIVVVKYYVDTEGRVRLPAVITATAPEFGAAALVALRQWRFEPPRIDGKPVIVLERHSFQFGATAQ